MEKLIYGICQDEECGRNVTEPNRKFCWRCLSLRTRTGYTYTGAMELRREKGKVCDFCNKFRKVLSQHGDKKACTECFRTILNLSQDRQVFNRITGFVKDLWLEV